MAVDIVETEPDATGLEWDAFLEAHEHGSFYHRHGWRRLNQVQLGHDCIYLVARDGDSITGIGPLVLKRDYVYLYSSFRFFFDKGEAFIGFLLLFFTIIFPVGKYIFLFITLAGRRLPRHRYLNTVLEIINKWAMLDVFVVAVLILNMKFDSRIIVSKLEYGTTLFAISVVLMMLSASVAGKLLHEQDQLK